jgi:adenine-specific DNA-methyltransferase
VRRVIKGVKSSKDEKLKAGLGGTFTYLELGAALDDESALSGSEMPSYLELAQYAFFTATGEKLDVTQMDEPRWYLGQSREYDVYLLYRPDIEFLKDNPLNLDFADKKLPPFDRSQDKIRLVIASHKYVDDFRLLEFGIEFCQLPFSIYKFRAK